MNILSTFTTQFYILTFTCFLFQSGDIKTYTRPCLDQFLHYRVFRVTV